MQKSYECKFVSFDELKIGMIFLSPYYRSLICRITGKHIEEKKMCDISQICKYIKCEMMDPVPEQAKKKHPWIKDSTILTMGDFFHKTFMVVDKDVKPKFFQKYGSELAKGDIYYDLENKKYYIVNKISRSRGYDDDIVTAYVAEVDEKNNFCVINKQKEISLHDSSGPITEPIGSLVVINYS